MKLLEIDNESNYKWHDYFLLLPRIVDVGESEKILWLETVQRRKRNGFYETFIEYRKLPSTQQ